MTKQRPAKALWLRLPLRPRSIAVLGVALGASYWMFETLMHTLVFRTGTFWSELAPRDAHEFWMRATVTLMFAGFGFLAGRSASRLEAQTKLANSLASTLGSFIPICSYCKKVREGDVWVDVEQFVTKRVDGTSFTHGICPACEERHFPDSVKRPERAGS